MSKLTDTTWWKDALKRAVATALAIALPYLGGALIAEVPWLTIVSAAGLGFLASLATSLAGLPESVGVQLPWWLAAVERVVKTFAQALAAGFLGATLLTDVAWSTVVQASAIAALTSLVRLILATLPNDPTPDAAVIESYYESASGDSAQTSHLTGPGAWAQRHDGPLSVDPTGRIHVDGQVDVEGQLRSKGD